MADFFEAVAAVSGKPKKASNWLMGETMRLLKENGMEAGEIRFCAQHLAKLIALVDDGTISGPVAKEVFAKMFDTDIDPERYVEENGLKTVHDQDALRDALMQALNDNPKSVEDYRNGKEKALGFLVGQTMKAMQGKANPKMALALLKEILSE